MRGPFWFTVVFGFGWVSAAIGQSPRVETCDIFPPDNVWNTPVDALPVDGRSAEYVTRIGRDSEVVTDFGSGRVQNAPIGIPFLVVPGTQPKVPMVFVNSLESDAGLYPIPGGAPVEGGPSATGNRRVLVLERDSCILYEISKAFPEGGGWKADFGAVFDLKASQLRPRNWGSADAAGLAVFPGLVRYDEVAAGEIRHALRMTAPQTQQAFVWPARHFASQFTDPALPPMGQRFRLKANFDVSGFSPAAQVILRAMKKYGMMLADNGSPWYLSGVPDERWNNDVLRELRRVRGSDLEAVDVSNLMRDPEAAYVRPEVRIANVTNGASFRPGYLAPGMIASIFGSQLANEPVETRIFFNNQTVRAVVLAATPQQINFIVPYSVADRTSVQMEVRYQNRQTFLGQVNIAPASPGIFTLDRSGRGGGAILNQDSSVNTPQNPAARGSIVQIFATGEGQTDPGGQDGRDNTVPAPVPRLPVRVTIGGLEAQLFYSGGAPGLVAGVLQVNARVPEGLNAGNQPVMIYVGNWPSQEGVTVAVR